MNKMRLGILGVAVVCALIAGVMVKNILSSKPAPRVETINTVEMRDILVAQADIPMGAKLEEGKAGWQSWPQAAIVEGMITKGQDTDVFGSRARFEILKGEPISRKKLVGPQSGFMAAVLEKGRRAVAVPVTVETGVGGFILPGDRVDVVALRDRAGVENGLSNRRAAETVLQNVRVLAIDQKIQSQGEGEQSVLGKTATLELEPRQVEVLTQFSGTVLTLSLRGLAEGDGLSKEEREQPVLSDRYSKNNGDGFMIYRYGIGSAAQ